MFLFGCGRPCTITTRPPCRRGTLLLCLCVSCLMSMEVDFARKKKKMPESSYNGVRSAAAVLRSVRWSTRTRFRTPARYNSTPLPLYMKMYNNRDANSAETVKTTTQQRAHGSPVLQRRRYPSPTICCSDTTTTTTTTTSPGIRYYLFYTEYTHYSSTRWYNVSSVRNNNYTYTHVRATAAIDNRMVQVSVAKRRAWRNITIIFCITRRRRWFIYRHDIYLLRVGGKNRTLNTVT